MVDTTSKINEVTIYKTRVWVKKAQYVLTELCACALRHTSTSRYLLHLPLEQLYPIAHQFAQGLSEGLLDNPAARSKFGQPFVALLQTEGMKPPHLHEFLDQLELFFNESLSQGFNAPAGPVKELLETRFYFYLRAAQATLTQLTPATLAADELMSGYRPSEHALRYILGRG